jgi:hypothetical protein
MPNGFVAIVRCARAKNLTAAGESITSWLLFVSGSLCWVSSSSSGETPFFFLAMNECCDSTYRISHEIGMDRRVLKRRFIDKNICQECHGAPAGVDNPLAWTDQE